MPKNTVPGDLLRLARCYPVRYLPCIVLPTCCCLAAWFDFYTIAVFTVYSTNPKAKQAHMAKYAELMKKDNYTPKTTEFALAKGLLTMRCTKAKKYAEETMGATLGLKNCISPDKENRVHLDIVVPTLQEAPQQIARWKRSSARSGANYALALTKAHFSEKVHNLER